MDIQKEYIIMVNGRPFFSVLDEAHIDVMRAEISLRFGDSVEVTVMTQTTAPYVSEAGED